MIIRDGWTPLRCSWGSSSDSTGGPGGATTGGGDWGSAGSFDASGFNAGGNALFGGPYDASVFGSGAGGGGDWGSFQATNYAGFNVSDPNATQNISLSPFDVAMSQTGGGDWGTSGQYNASGLNVDPGASNYSSGGSFYGGDTGSAFDTATGAYSGYSPYGNVFGGQQQDSYSGGGRS